MTEPPDALSPEQGSSGWRARSDEQGTFEEYRGVLFAVAYRMLGTASDAEDMVQDAWIRWSGTDRAQVEDVRNYLIKIVTNLSLDRLRALRTQRETYVGPWLPEPILTVPDAGAGSESAASVSMAMLVVLETLSPLERAVFLLKEAFGFPYREIAEALGRSEKAVRQLGTRARNHVRARRSRFPADPEAQRAATERFIDATLGGDINKLMEALAPDVALWTDGGGKVRAARRVIHGADKVARLSGSGLSRGLGGVTVRDMTFRTAEINGAPGVVIEGPDGAVGALTVELDADGRIATLFAVGNPDKLHHIAGGRALTV